MNAIARFSAPIDQWSKLALLRFVLASIVAFNHLADSTSLGVFAVIPMLGAFEAILGFLLVSGYSIGVSYSKEPTNFLWRRVKRIYPIYLASLVLVGIVLATGGGAMPPIWEWVANLLFLNQVVVGTSIVGPAWSLSLEFWLYCLTPLLFTLSEKSLKWLIALSLFSFCIYTCGRTLFHWNYYSGTRFGINLLILSFIWIAGLYLSKAAKLEQRLKIWLAIVAIFALYMAMTVAIQGAYRLKNGQLEQFFRTDLIYFVMQTITLVGVALLFRNILRQAPGGKPSGWMRMLGDISFPLYVLHIPVFDLLHRAGLESPVVYFAAAFGASAVAYRVLDLYSQRRHAPKKMPAAAIG